MMEADVSPEAAAFLWNTTLIYLRPDLTPHPDDNLAIDLPILEEDWILDWPRDFAREQGLVESNLPDWPEGWQPTVRNYGRWLSLGLTG